MNDVALAKLASIERCLRRIREITGGDAASVRKLDVQEIVVLNLQRAIQPLTSFRSVSGACQTR